VNKLGNIDRSFEAALYAVLESGKPQRELGARRDTLLKKLLNIGYANQFSPEDRVNARRDIKKVVAEYLGQNLEEIVE
jgi:hypothetical protein